MLIIYDEAEIRESRRLVPGLEGFAVETAASGEAGLQRIGEHPFDLILLDLTLPGRNGLEILAEIRSHENGLPVIMITAYGTVENAVRAMSPAPPTSFRNLGTMKSFWPMCAPPWAGAAPKKKISQLKRALKQRYNFQNMSAKASRC